MKHILQLSCKASASSFLGASVAFRLGVVLPCTADDRHTGFAECDDDDRRSARNGTSSPPMKISCSSGRPMSLRLTLHTPTMRSAAGYLQDNRPVPFRHGREHGQSSKIRPPMNHAVADSGIPLVVCFSTLSQPRRVVYFVQSCSGNGTCRNPDRSNGQHGCCRRASEFH